VVHYVLDGIDIPSVVGKGTYGVMGGANGVPITTTELRFMFRYWHRLKAAATNRKIIFYSEQKAVTAPWYQGANLWLPYAKHRINKILDVNPRPKTKEYEKIFEAASRFEQKANAGRATEALQIFFSMETTNSIDQEPTD
jgi:hypothetical protein